MNIRKSQCFSDKKGEDTKMCCLKYNRKKVLILVGEILHYKERERRLWKKMESRKIKSVKVDCHMEK